MVTRRNSLFFKRTFEKPPTKTFLELCNEFLVQGTLGKEHLTKPIEDHERTRAWESSHCLYCKFSQGIFLDSLTVFISVRLSEKLVLGKRKTNSKFER